LVRDPLTPGGLNNAGQYTMCLNSNLGSGTER